MAIRKDGMKGPAKKTTAKKAPAKKDAPTAAAPSDWPSVGGKPLVKISFSASEKVPTGDYANVTIGPVTVTRFVEDGDEDHLAAELAKLAETVEVKCISEQREIVHESLKAKAKG